MASTSTDLRVVDILGVFYRARDHRLCVADEFEGTRDVEAVLGEFGGSRVRMLAHHRPQEPHDDSRWGGGCCLLEASGRCHFGHHDDPRRLFTFDGGGVLRSGDGGWVLDGEHGPVSVWLDALVGHRSQVIVMAIPDTSSLDEAVNEEVGADLHDARVEDLLERLRRARDLVERINDIKSGVDG